MLRAFIGDTISNALMSEYSSLRDHEYKEKEMADELARRYRKELKTIAKQILEKEPNGGGMDISNNASFYGFLRRYDRKSMTLRVKKDLINLVSIIVIIDNKYRCDFSAPFPIDLK